jgi:recombinational DNA repair ATPase RecF
MTEPKPESKTVQAPVRLLRFRDLNFRSYQHWNQPEPDFEKITLIHGLNGSGKSTLAEALRADSVSGSVALSNCSEMTMGLPPVWLTLGVSVF